jgi:hypothetical protein
VLTCGENSTLLTSGILVIAPTAIITDGITTTRATTNTIADKTTWLVILVVEKSIFLIAKSNLLP